MNKKKVQYFVISAVIVLIDIAGCFANRTGDNSTASFYTSGIADIDQIRVEIDSTPTTIENALNRHAALNRWWLVPLLTNPGAMLHIRRSISLEMMFGLLILSVTAYLSTVVGPPSHL